MYRPADLKNGLLNLVGWRQNANTADFTIGASLVTSSSGLYYQDFHPLLTLDNLKAVAPPFDDENYAAWLIDTQYYEGDKVSVGDNTYRALRDNIGKTPVTYTEDWERSSGFSEWLEQKTGASILKTMNRLWDEKIAASTARNILENKALFNGTGRLLDLITETSNLVGLEIVPLRSNGVTVKIEKIGLQFTGTGAMVLYLMHSSRKDPIRILSFTRTRPSGMEWFDVSDLYLPYVSDDNDAGGSWYLVYSQSELPDGSQAVSKVRDWSQKPCLSCDRDEYASWQAWSKYLEIHPFKIGSDDIVTGDYVEEVDSRSSGIQMWDVADNLYTYTTNYGINLRVSVECDITDILLEQKRVLQNLIGLGVACDMLRELAYNPNVKVNRNQMNTPRTDILYEVDGDSRSNKKSGIRYDFEQAMKSVSVDIRGLSRECFQCKNGGVRYKAI